MTTKLEQGLIRLAETNAKLRPHLLPLLAKQASGGASLITAIEEGLMGLGKEIHRALLLGLTADYKVKPPSYVGDLAVGFVIQGPAVLPRANVMVGFNGQQVTVAFTMEDGAGRDKRHEWVFPMQITEAKIGLMVREKVWYAINDFTGYR